MSDANSTNVEYRDIPGHPGYRAGSDGSIWSCWKQESLGLGCGTRCVMDRSRWHPMKPRMRARYLAVTLKGKAFSVHVLVALAFHGPRPAGMQVRHFPDRHFANCRAENLRYGTQQENEADKAFHNVKVFGEQHKLSKLTEEDVRQMRHEYACGGWSYSTLGLRYGISNVSVGRIVRREAWKHVR